MAGAVELAEAYVLWQQHKEKKKAEKGRTNRSSGCFSWFIRKLRRSTKVINSNDKVKVSTNP
ncbi:hypothetical protein Fmac_031616 [Flemingia macrophylla]|uniref:Ribosomal protein L32 n=1 Tax=Flemingia macrophylla TaxID=520843 RepID=A0ABD1L2J7_9FABA